MDISILGAITIILSVYAFFKNEKLLLYIMVFLSTFTAAMLIYIEPTTTPIQTFQFTEFVWLLREFINFIKSKPKLNKEEIINKFKQNKIALAFLIFIIAIILGEVFFLVSGMKIDYTNSNGEQGVLKFSKSNITMGAFTILIFVNMIVLSFKIKTKKEIKELINVFCISSAFAVLWGFFQFVIFYIGIPYPTFLFNNNLYAAQHYDHVYNNVKRISSIALEPSTLGVNLICFIPFIMGAVLKYDGQIKNKKYILIFTILVLSTVATILTVSTTALCGIAFVYGLFVLYIIFRKTQNGENFNKKRSLRKIFVAGVLAIVLVLLLYIIFIKIGLSFDILVFSNFDESFKAEEGSSEIDNIVKTFNLMTVNKGSTGSFKNRMETEKIGFSLLKYSPLFGFGFVSYRTFSMFTNILMNAGIVRSDITFICSICSNK